MDSAWTGSVETISEISFDLLNDLINRNEKIQFDFFLHQLQQAISSLGLISMILKRKNLITHWNFIPTVLIRDQVETGDWSGDWRSW